MAYTANNIANIAANLLDHYERTQSKDSASYNKPTWTKMVAKKKEFGATKGEIILPVRLTHGNGGVNDGLKGIGPGSKLDFAEHANERSARYPRRKHHNGMTMTEDEMEDAGITIVDEMGGMNSPSAMEHANLKDYLKARLSDFNENWDEKANTLLWGDGSSDSMAMAGIRSIILDNPLSGTVGGLSCALNPQWRNRAYTAAHGTAGGTGAITSSTSGGGELIQILQKDKRQIERFKSRVDLRPSGSDFLDALERELRANGNYYDRGVKMDNETEIDGIKTGGVEYYYDPELDNIGRAKYSYAICSKDVRLWVRKGLWKRDRKPARPHDELVIHLSRITTMQLCADKLNGCAVYQIN